MFLAMKPASRVENFAPYGGGTWLSEYRSGISFRELLTQDAAFEENHSPLDSRLVPECNFCVEAMPGVDADRAD